MGAALTNARRYALFALAGIAAEDDLDPDLNAKIDLEASKGAKAVAAASRAPPPAVILRGSGADRQSSFKPQGAEFASLAN